MQVSQLLEAESGSCTLLTTTSYNYPALGNGGIVLPSNQQLRCRQNLLIFKRGQPGSVMQPAHILDQD